MQPARERQQQQSVMGPKYVEQQRTKCDRVRLLGSLQASSPDKDVRGLLYTNCNMDPCDGAPSVQQHMVRMISEVPQVSRIHEACYHSGRRRRPTSEVLVHKSQVNMIIMVDKARAAASVSPSMEAPSAWSGNVHTHACAQKCIKFMVCLKNQSKVIVSLGDL
jgi:hypothetical protein